MLFTRRLHSLIRRRHFVFTISKYYVASYLSIVVLISFVFTINPLYEHRRYTNIAVALHVSYRRLSFSLSSPSPPPS